jgi:transposase
MIRNRHLAQAIDDSAWSSFVTKFEYKAEWLEKTVLRIGQFVPSTKLCNVCGYHNSNLTLKEENGYVLIARQNTIEISMLQSISRNSLFKIKT